MEFKTGSLVKVRGRDWVVQPSADPELLIIKPLGGGEEETAGIFLPLGFPEDHAESSQFGPPQAGDIGDIASARLLYNALRLSFRDGAGPFRSLARLSFRPRAYQMVPLIMALRHGGEPVRLLIADDVGVGKTIEALLILKELLERREVKRFAIICLPHLCEQWQTELAEKFGIEAVIIRSNTQARLDRQIRGDESIYSFYPYQIISVDYIKSQARRAVFVNECPELVIVDEAHSCARPKGADKSKQQRYALIKDIAGKPATHLVLLTATPHSGKAEEFGSLLGLLKEEYETLEIPTAGQEKRKELARHFVQRRRADVTQWMGNQREEKTIFPERQSGDIGYGLSRAYDDVFRDVFSLAKALTEQEETQANRKRLHYWTALALLRGVLSSPAAGAAMIRNRIRRLQEGEKNGETLPEAEAVTLPEQPALFEDDASANNDTLPSGLLSGGMFTGAQEVQLDALAGRLEALADSPGDNKAVQTAEVIREWLAEGFRPIIFCRYIETAKYLGAVLQKMLGDGINIQVVTSEDPDEVRRERIADMKDTDKRVLVATDCLSEGINLQDLFNAVLHYDLPWNPNRLEQREGRVDRYGQTAPVVKAYLLYAKENEIEGVVLKVLLTKVREIRRSIGISLPFSEDSQALMEAVVEAMMREAGKDDRNQLFFDFDASEAVNSCADAVTLDINAAAEREKASRAVFAQHAIKAQEIETDLAQADLAIGDPAAVEAFVVQALERLGVQFDRRKEGYRLYTANLPDALKRLLPAATRLEVTFLSPVPAGHLYLGRNHPFIEQLCQLVGLGGLEEERRASRAAVVRSLDVAVKTTVLLYRVRSVIEEEKGKERFVAEEMLAWGYRGLPGDGDWLDQPTALALLETAVPSGDLTPESRASLLEQELSDLPGLKDEIDRLAEERAAALIDSYTRFRRAVRDSQVKRAYHAVKPVLPPDLVGVYILLPGKGA